MSENSHKRTWHQLSVAEALEQRGSGWQGLTEAETALRLEQFGPNQIREKNKVPGWMLFLKQFRDVMILILVAAAVIAAAFGDFTDAVIIVMIVILNATIGFLQEYRAEKALEALKKMASLNTEVKRNGRWQTLASVHLVPGDLVRLQAGVSVPADLRILESFGLRIDESALTGESVPIDKHDQVIPSEAPPLGDRFNMAFKGTAVTNGRGTGLVVETGMKTEFGKIAQMLQVRDALTPLQKRMSDFSKKLSLIILAICLIVFVAGWLRGENRIDMLLLAISLAVAAIPEALPALISVALAQGAKRLMKLNALIRKLPAVETLGSVSYICSDKTGTLTTNKMRVVKTETAADAPQLALEMHALDLGFLLNHDVKINADGQLQGDTMEIAMVEYMSGRIPADQSANIRKTLIRISEIPFDSDRKSMSVLVRFGERYLLLVKGAAEYIAEHLEDPSEGSALLQQTETWAKNGLRVLAFAYRIFEHEPKPIKPEREERHLKYAGLAGLIDPARPEIAGTIRECKAAGIQTVMITGDHPATAAAIARETGILTEQVLIWTGADLQARSPEEFDELVEHIRVYARVSPEQKLNIIKALQQRGHYVAMTGDGVNDAPCLKSADMGIAMGINGTDVAKESAHMILLDDRFTTIVKAVKEGRRIYDNIRKFVKYIMTCNGAEIMTITLAPVFGLPIPLLPIQILWINLVTDGLPGLALANEKPERDIMQQPPRPPKESLFAHGVLAHIIWVGCLMAGLTLGVQALAMSTAVGHWQTMVFTTLSWAQLGHVVVIRSDRSFVYRHGLFANKPLMLTVLITGLLQLFIVYHPVPQTLFKTQSLSLEALGICMAAAVILFHAVELEKWIKLKFRKSPKA